MNLVVSFIWGAIAIWALWAIAISIAKEMASRKAHQIYMEQMQRWQDVINNPSSIGKDKTHAIIMQAATSEAYKNWKRRRENATARN